MRIFGRDAGEIFTNFDVGTVHFRHMGVQVSRIRTIFYGESVLEIFASFDLDKYKFVKVLARVSPKNSQLLRAVVLPEGGSYRLGVARPFLMHYF